MMRAGDAAAIGALVDVELTTTAGSLALTNLQAHIDGLQRQSSAGDFAVDAHITLIELVALRGHVLGSIADYESAHARADQLTRDRPADSAALIALARSRSIFHRFTDALEDLADARRLGADSATVDAERATIFQAVGRYDDALSIMSEADKRRADFTSVAALASLYAESGDVDRAEHLFTESLNRYRGVSPIPLAQLYFQRAKMWLEQGDLRRARSLLDAANRRLPAYAPARGHLAEVEAALGETDSAIARLRPLTTSSDDPDYPAQLARILTEVGRVEEARQLRAQAAARYDALVAQYPDAFADHAAEFLLDAGADPRRALSLARRNLAVRQTPRARALLSRATRANDHAPRAAGR